MDLPVDADRLREDMGANAAFGRIADDDPEKRGRTNLTGTEANRAARDRLVERFEDAGLAVAVDAVGNLVGTWTPDSADPDAAPVASGSHLDSVPEGGIFDGPLGVYAPLEAVRAMRDAEVEPARPVAVVSFTEEEGATFGDGLLGSSVATGVTSVDEALALEDDAGETLGEALDRIGYRGDDAIDPASWAAFYELHVEQDTVLEEAGADAGVVTTITGITHCEATIEGEANHAGATAMGDRTDALAAASEFVLDVEAAANEVVATESESAVGTVGSLSVSPNATNVVPGRVEAGVDVRDVNTESMEAIVSAARDSLARLERERGVETAFERPFDVAPTPMSDRLRDAAHVAAEAAGRTAIDLHSGAAHDAMRVARVTDASLLFAPSRDGISHNPREWTDWADCAAATEVLAGALARVASE
ncbi:amidase, hydantoinase/carbamoylase family protein [Halorubrum saccharovorum DSM 1137]|uniref:Amidase, hydantoinase/carbamoylase family protein n=1 Tax=Halorubrum saccharovorum DSM 1137 TaxID=1227484 RepID=M0E660_9EURY|nr:Zn-dependent hydrolase [Halorubrum saccharovorum]ELZ43290.1 amidase, hydantoinase/carbamoylase family protein [Halorubrum saccharovorum DSM 1137]